MFKWKLSQGTQHCSKPKKSWSHTRNTRRGNLVNDYKHTVRIATTIRHNHPAAHKVCACLREPTAQNGVCGAWLALSSALWCAGQRRAAPDSGEQRRAAESSAGQRRAAPGSGEQRRGQRAGAIAAPRRGMYLFAISYVSDAVDQRSGLAWFSGWIKVFVIYTGYFNAKFLSTWCEDCFSAEQNHPLFSLPKEGSEEQKYQKQDRFFRDRQIAYLIYDYFRFTGVHDSVENYSDLVHYWFTKWRYSGIRFKVGRSSTVYDEKSTWWHFGRIVQIKNTWVWKTQDRIGSVRPGDSSEKVKTWLSQIEDCGEKKYRARYTKEEFWRQKRKVWEESRGQESRDKTACTKNPWRLLAIGNQRAVCERRQLQFPPRYR